jgi:hypothetical protein
MIHYDSHTCPYGMLLYTRVDTWPLQNIWSSQVSIKKKSGHIFFGPAHLNSFPSLPLFFKCSPTVLDDSSGKGHPLRAPQGRFRE